MEAAVLSNPEMDQDTKNSALRVDFPNIPKTHPSHQSHPQPPHEHQNRNRNRKRNRNRNRNRRQGPYQKNIHKLPNRGELNP